MTREELCQLRDLAEKSKVQFKERIVDPYDICCEMVAQANGNGGYIVIGINDKSGAVNALSFVELQDTTAQLGNIASVNVCPSVLIGIETVAVEDGAVVVASIPAGKNKPYRDNKGIIWVKQGADRRKVFDNSELAELMTESGNYRPELSVVHDATMRDLDQATIKRYLLKRFPTETKEFVGARWSDTTADEMASAILPGATAEQLMRNAQLIREDGQMTMAAMLLFGKATQRWLPVMTAKCISFVGNSVGGSSFRDKVHDMDMEGNLLHQYETIMAFFARNLRRVQVEANFNTIGELELPVDSLTEFVVNALVHRSLNISAPIRVFIFDNRVEIHSPGELPHGLTVEMIKHGTSQPRNMFLFTHANFLLPYTGAGSGIVRAMQHPMDVQFESNDVSHEFIITLTRPIGESNQESDHQNVQESVQESVYQSVYQNGKLMSGKQLENKGLTKKQVKVILFCTIPRNSQEILTKLGLTNHPSNRESHITPLLEMGYLRYTIPSNPKDRNQKYVRVK